MTSMTLFPTTGHPDEAESRASGRFFVEQSVLNQHKHDRLSQHFTMTDADSNHELEIKLASGDSITGTIASLSSNYLRFRTGTSSAGDFNPSKLYAIADITAIRKINESAYTAALATLDAARDASEAIVRSAVRCAAYSTAFAGGSPSTSVVSGAPAGPSV